MMLWLILTLLSLAAAAIMARPLMQRSPPQAGTGDPALDGLRAQVDELDREVAEGTITAEEAAATRREIERRVLAAARKHQGERTTVISDKGLILAVTIAVGWVVVGSAILYATIGRPDLAGAPVRQAATAAPAPAAATELAAAPATGSDATSLASVDAMTTQLAERLTREPKDLDGWRMLGWSYAQLGRFEDAAAAYGHAVDLAPNDAETLSLRGEARVNAQQGRVDPAALADFDKSLGLDPGNARARYYKGMAQDEAGDTAGAVTLWLALVDAAPAGAVWLPDLKAHILDRAKAAGIDLTGRPDLQPEATPAPAAAAPGPSAADVAAAADMTPEDRATMIRGMVGRLAAQLAAQPDDPDGWQRLLRAYVVLGDTQAATAALANASTALAGDATALASLKAAAAALGLPPS